MLQRRPSAPDASASSRDVRTLKTPGERSARTTTTGQAHRLPSLQTLAAHIRGGGTSGRSREDRPARAKRPPNTARFLALIVIAVAAYFVPRGISWNADTHIFLTSSIVDRGSLTIDPLARFTGDVAFAHGHYYADKAPGLSFAAIPLYALLKWTILGGHPYTSLFTVPVAQRTDFFVRYILTVALAAVPTGVLVAMLYTFLARFGLGSKARTAVALTYGLGTIARPFAGELFSHQLSALLVFSAFALLYRVRHGEGNERLAAVAGLLIGYAVITEYPVALIALALGLYALTIPERGRRLAVWFASGAAPCLLLGAVYNTLTFGGPLSVGYGHLAGPLTFRIGQAQGIFGVTYPHLDALWQTTFGPYRGLFLLCPVLLLAIPGFARLWSLRAWRAEVVTWLAIVLVYALFTISYFEWDGGFSMGPRQFLPALPFAMPAVAAVLLPGGRAIWRRLFAPLAVLSVVIVELATATSPLFDPNYGSPLTQWVLPHLRDGALDNNWGQLFHLPGVLQFLPLLLALAFAAYRHWRRLSSGATLSAVAG